MNTIEALSHYRHAISTAILFGNKNPLTALVGILYARMILHIGPFYYSLFSFYCTPFKAWPSYILNKEANTKVRQISSFATQRLIADKIQFYQRLRACALPTIPIISIVSPQPASVDGIRTLSSADDFSGHAQTFPESVFFKIVNGAHGENAFMAKRLNGGWTFNGQNGSSEDLFDYCMRQLRKRPGWLVQPRIGPHATIAASLSPNALCTARIITALKPDGIRFIGAVLKIPVGDNVTDNFSEGASGNLIAPIDIKSGLLGFGMISRSRIWPEMMRASRHPDTGSDIYGFQLPFWKETLEIVGRAQQELREAPTLGWDVAITDNGPVLVEANINYGVEIHQIALQRGLREDLSVVFELCRNAHT